MYTECGRYIITERFQCLGFIIDLERSQLVPTQGIKFLAFKIDSLNMTPGLTKHKEHDVQSLCKEVTYSDTVRTRKITSLLSNTIASFKAAGLEP